jgi:hypothetical protein
LLDNEQTQPHEQQAECNPGDQYAEQNSPGTVEAFCIGSCQDLFRGKIGGWGSRFERQIIDKAQLDAAMDSYPLA